MLTVKVRTDNAAFQDGNKVEECADILTAVVSQLREGMTAGVCHDVNGNKVGTWELT